ncbi:hypothetical protein ABIC17_004082 [Sphingomonas sp. PvP056]
MWAGGGGRFGRPPYFVWAYTVGGGGGGAKTPPPPGGGGGGGGPDQQNQALCEALPHPNPSPEGEGLRKALTHLSNHLVGGTTVQ